MNMRFEEEIKDILNIEYAMFMDRFCYKVYNEKYSNSNGLRMKKNHEGLYLSRWFFFLHIFHQLPYFGDIKV